MRIIGGKHRGRRLADFAGKDIRPTSDRAREALFNILAPRIAGAAFLDLFSGSGAIGLEALSRGAGRVYFNDCSKQSIAVLNKNLTSLGEGERARVSNQDYALFLSTAAESFDIIFIDPPYKEDFGERALKLIADRKLLKEGGVIIYERDRVFTSEAPLPLTKTDERTYGKNHFTFFTL